MNNSVIIKPIITEKTMTEAQQGRYTFRVKLDADKRTIAAEVATLFNVKVLGVRTVISKGKSKLSGKKRTKKTLEPIKKALVIINPEKKIDLFEISTT